MSDWREEEALLHGMMFREGEIDQPTHWMPLLAPPAAQGGEDE